MIPGSALYYAMQNVVYREFEEAAQSANTALTIALAISLGIVFVTVITKIKNELIRKDR